MVKRFDIYLVNLDAEITKDAKNTRPCVVVSPDEMNGNVGHVLIAPVSSASGLYPTRIPVELLNSKRYIVLDQIRTVDVERLVKKIANWIDPPARRRWTYSKNSLPSSALTIISGGQTGVDRAALDVAIEIGLPYRGFVPQGRWAEDGIIPRKYKGLTECDSSEPALRTRLNVENSHATLILSHGKLSGGSLVTWQAARNARKPCLHIDPRSQFGRWCG